MKLFVYLFTLVFSVSSVLAYQKGPMWSDPVTYIKLVGIWIIIISVLIVVFKKAIQEKHKKFLFWIMAAPVLLATFYLAGNTVYANITSATKGPVHWHADFQVWVCDERLDLIDPTGLSNKIGTPLFHEHDDDRIHVEGVVQNLADVDVGSFIEVVGGELTATSLMYPTNDGVVSVENGDECNGQPSTLKVFVNGQRHPDPANYLYAPEALVPPGDCLIIEFSPTEGETTDRICESWDALGWSYDNYEQKRGGE